MTASPAPRTDRQPDRRDTKFRHVMSGIDEVNDFPTLGWEMEYLQFGSEPVGILFQGFRTDRFHLARISSTGHLALDFDSVPKPTVYIPVWAMEPPTTCGRPLASDSILVVPQGSEGFSDYMGPVDAFELTLDPDLFPDLGAGDDDVGIFDAGVTTRRLTNIDPIRAACGQAMTFAAFESDPAALAWVVDQASGALHRLEHGRRHALTLPEMLRAQTSGRTAGNRSK